jgi:two-component system nitrogen regulation response regulator GlnG
MSGETILVADDDGAIRTVITEALSRLGYDVRAAANAATLWRWVEEGDGDLVVTDVIMPDENGLDLLPRIQQIRPDLKIVVMSAQSTMMTALRAAEQGAYEYLPKPFDLNEMITVVQRGLAEPKRRSAPSADGATIEEQLPLIGRSPAMQDVYRILARMMSTDLTVMIVGESGTGKELVARALHEFGQRRNGPFVAINMAAIPRELVESELFGHERGAFTGATARGIGRFEQAQGGTLFLDEIGDMPLDAQTRLLRVLQEGEYTTVGGRRALKADVRIVAATHRDLNRLVHQGGFREDLFYRLNVVPIRLPPLRERREDIPELTRHFLARAAAEGLRYKVITKAGMDRLQRHDWPGNVRELENTVRRLAALYSEDEIGEAVMARELDTPLARVEAPAGEAETLSASVERHLNRYFTAHAGDLPPAGLYARVLREVERPLITRALSATRGNQIKAAELLGLNRNTLRKKIRELDIEVVRGIK